MVKKKSKKKTSGKKSKRKTKSEKALKIKYQLDMDSRKPEVDGNKINLYSKENFILDSMHRKAIDTGVTIEIPKGYVGLVRDNSDLALKEGLISLQQALNQGKRRVKVNMVNLSSRRVEVSQGVKIAELIIQKVERPDLKQDKSKKAKKKNLAPTGTQRSDLKDIKKEVLEK